MKSVDASKHDFVRPLEKIQEQVIDWLRGY